MNGITMNGITAGGRWQEGQEGSSLSGLFSKSCHQFQCLSGLFKSCHQLQCLSGLFGLSGPFSSLSPIAIWVLFMLMQKLKENFSKKARKKFNFHFFSFQNAKIYKNFQSNLIARVYQLRYIDILKIYWKLLESFKFLEYLSNFIQIYI